MLYKIIKMYNYFIQHIYYNIRSIRLLIGE